MTDTATTIAIKRRKARRTAIQGSEIITMTAATATAAPAKRGPGRPRKDEATAVPEFDFSKLEVKTGVAMPKQERAKESNPFLTHVKDSFENDDARQVVIPAVQAKRVESLIRRAADILTETPGATARVGVTVHTSEADGAGNVTVTFAAKERRARKANGTGEIATESAS